MNRRHFLLQSARWILGGTSGINLILKQTAGADPGNPAFSNPKIALIIDDIGCSRSQAGRFLALNVPITFSVLPHLRYSKILAGQIRESGHEVMLHQPMEPYNASLDPGPGALYVGTPAGEITRIIQDNINSIPFVSGVNNHMGSKFTSRKKEMNQTLDVVRENRLFFIDSLTSYQSVAFRAAKHYQIAAGRRNYFLDHVPESPAILGQLAKVRRYAQKHGSAVAIGHPYGATARAIQEFARTLMGSGVSLVHASAVIS